MPTRAEILQCFQIIDSPNLIVEATKPYKRWLVGVGNPATLMGSVMALALSRELQAIGERELGVQVVIAIEKAAQHNESIEKTPAVRRRGTIHPAGPWSRHG